MTSRSGPPGADLRSEVGLESLLDRAVGPTPDEVTEHPVGADAQDVEALPRRLVGQGVGEVGLADASLAADQDISPLADEGAGPHVEDLLAIDHRVEREVERLESLGRVEVAAAQPQVELLLSAALDLVLDESREELQAGPLLGDGLLAAPA